MARVGIDVSQALGVSMPDIRAVAKTCGVDHALALELWETEIHEARILATLVADPDALTEPQRERWVLDITSWDLCDSAADLFGRAPAHSDAIKGWARRPEPFVKRCAFSMIARRAVWAKQAPDREFLGYLPLIRRAADRSTGTRSRRVCRGRSGRSGSGTGRCTRRRSTRRSGSSSSRRLPPGGSRGTPSGSSRARRPAPGSRTDARLAELARTRPLAGLDQLGRRIRHDDPLRLVPFDVELREPLQPLGRYQFRSPSSCIDAGTSRVRTIVASRKTATASPNPICWSGADPARREAGEHRDHDDRGARDDAPRSCGGRTRPPRCCPRSCRSARGSGVRRNTW